MAERQPSAAQQLVGDLAPKPVQSTDEDHRCAATHL